MSLLSDLILHKAPLHLNQKSNDLGVNAIVRNVQHILNTRSSIGIKKFLAEDTILDNLSFGLPDFAFLSISSSIDKNTLSQAIKKSIAAFEPRLQAVTIDLGGYDSLKREVIVKVAARFDRDNIAVNFILNLSNLEFQIDERER